MNRPERPQNPTNPTPENAADGKRRGRPKVEKVPYRKEGDALLKAWPEDYDRRVHTPLAVSDFEAEDVFWAKKAEFYEEKASECRQKAELFQKYGSAEKRKTVEKISKLNGQLELLMGQLESEGFDTSELLANMRK